MGMPTPIVHPDDTGSITLWEDDGEWWDAAVVNGGQLDYRVYGIKIDGGGRTVQWVIDCAVEDWSSLLQKLDSEGGEDRSTFRVGTLGMPAMPDKVPPPEDSGDVIKDIKGLGPDYTTIEDPNSCQMSNEGGCTTDLDEEYPPRI